MVEKKKSSGLKSTKLTKEDVKLHIDLIGNIIVLECGCGGLINDFSDRFKKTFGGVE